MQLGVRRRDRSEAGDGILREGRWSGAQASRVLGAGVLNMLFPRNADIAKASREPGVQRPGSSLKTRLTLHGDKCYERAGIVWVGKQSVA